MNSSKIKVVWFKVTVLEYGVGVHHPSCSGSLLGKEKLSHQHEILHYSSNNYSAKFKSASTWDYYFSHNFCLVSRKSLIRHWHDFMYRYPNSSQRIIYDYHSVEHYQASLSKDSKEVHCGAWYISYAAICFCIQRMYHRGLLLLNEVPEGKAPHQHLRLCQDLVLPA